MAGVTVIIVSDKDVDLKINKFKLILKWKMTPSDRSFY